MTLSVLISCMHQTDTSIVGRSNVKTDAVVVNQCDHDKVEEIHEGQGTLFISTTERGLSRSRNKAIENAKTDICLIMDDDEVLADDYASTILGSYSAYPEADVIVFQVANAGKAYPSKPQRLGYLGALKVGSLQISFKRQSVRDAGILFDTEMGSGTGHGAGEENAFLYACLRKGLKVMYVPRLIATLDKDSASQWFNGYDARYFLERGWATARYMGKPLATAYAFYYTIRKRSLYKRQLSMASALANTLKGIMRKEI